MSRVGKRILSIPSGVNISNENNFVTIEGSKGKISKQFSSLINIIIKDGNLTTERINEEKHTKQLHGTTNSLISSMLIGVSQGFQKKLIIKGVGYKASLQQNKIEILAGYSHPHYLEIPSSLNVTVPTPTEIIIEGISKEVVGQFAANIRKVRKPNVYSGKGIMYSDEIIRRKEGKSTSKK